MARKDKMKREEMKKLLEEAKSKRYKIRISLSDDQTDWALIASVLVESNSSGSIELDPPTIEEDLCMAALRHDLSAFEDGLAFYPTQKLDPDDFLNRLPTSTLLQRDDAAADGTIINWPLGPYQRIPSC